MKTLSTDEIRQAYLDFFASKDHTIIPGAPLVPENDPTVLFTTAGMHPLVPYLLGEPHPGGKRIANCQRCIRTQDIDEVGDISHLTLFEMLGNWSLGDYFKEEAIQMSFEFLTEVLEIPKEKLAVTCFRGDDDAPKDEEAANYWKTVGIPEDRIGFLNKKENWWGPAGQTGPCGPDTEIFYWIGGGDPHGNPEKNEDDWLEIWNDVFMQYMKTENGKFEPLAQQNVDTGMGLERVASVLQGKKSVYETDRMKPIMDRVVSLCEYPKLSDYEPLQHGENATRIIVDHLRAATFIIADGVLPSNVDQGYILRRLIRRAIRSARTMEIKFEGEFCLTVADEVISQYGHIYNNLKEHSKDIKDALSNEEQRFKKVIDDVFAKYQLSHRTEEGEPYHINQITGAEAFDLFTTYGLPIEIIIEEAEYKVIPLEPDFQKNFDKLFKEHQEKSRAGAEQRFSGGLADQSAETTKLHTATHLLDAALRKILGKHVFQKGSNITAERLRFDFSHTEKMTKEQIQQVEGLVNKAIKADFPINYHITNIKEAKEENAIGVFDDRYGNEVKVYVIGNDKMIFSKEICGGPHVARTGMIGSFKIKKEESSSAGVRRIKATISGGSEKIDVAQESEE